MRQLKILYNKYYHISKIDESEYSKKVFERESKLKKIIRLRLEQCSEKTALEIMNIKRATYFRWKQRYKKFGLIGLENESRRPNQLRKPKWTKEIELRVYNLRKQYPLYGKAKITIIYKKMYKEKISESTIGRIIKKLMDKGKIKPVNFVCGKKFIKPREFNNYAKRWKRGMKAKRIGELIQIDHMTVNIPKNGYIKQFNAICPITKITVEGVYKKATSANAADFLKKIINKFPFTIKSIQVDGGSEFMKDFENECKKNNISLFVLPPKSPKDNAHVERVNGTFRYEFYSQYEGSKNFNNVKKALNKFVYSYNNFRPHQGLDYLTPNQFFEVIKDEVQKVSYVLN